MGKSIPASAADVNADSASCSLVWVRRSLFALLAALGFYGLLFVYHAAHLAFAQGELNYAESTWLFAAIR